MNMYEWPEDRSSLRRPGLIFGVCRWVADRLGISAIWVRLAVILIGWWTAWWATIAIYLAAAIALGRTERTAGRSRVREWSSRAGGGLWSRLAELERRVESAEFRYRRG
jgi:phage shock protein PspC (stress-responsive transcriptional regulator)